MIESIIYAFRKYGHNSVIRTAFSCFISDAVIISFRKTGKTWLRLMYGKMLQEQYNIKKIKLNTEYMTLLKPLPNVMFSHAGTTKRNNKLDFRKLFKKKKIVFLTRDPRAMMFPLFYDYTKRSSSDSSYNGTISNFIRDPRVGIRSVIASMNTWAEEIKSRRDLKVIKYENLFLHTKRELKRMLSFLNIHIDDENITKAIEFGSAKNMRKMEKAGTFKDNRMTPGNKIDLNSYKARKCKLGSFLEELSHNDLEYLNKEIQENLDPVFGYETYDYVNKIEGL